MQRLVRGKVLSRFSSVFVGSCFKCLKAIFSTDFGVIHPCDINCPMSHVRRSHLLVRFFSCEMSAWSHDPAATSAAKNGARRCSVHVRTGIGKVVFGCPAEVLGAISGEELDVDCRDVLSSGVLHAVDVVGPVCGEKAAAQHRVRTFAQMAVYCSTQPT